MNATYLNSATQIFRMYKQLGEKAIAQVDEKQLTWQANEDSNSITTIVKHLWGNMLSRWTDFLISDGEKPWRNRDAEFENEEWSKTVVLEKWEQGWDCLFAALNTISETDLDKIIYIRNEGHTVLEAINRQIAHYSYHIGQIVYVSKLLSRNDWQSLSIPKNKSIDYNKDKFAKEKEIRNFTEDWIKKK